MYHWNKINWETYLSDTNNTQTVISLKYEFLDKMG